MIMLHPASHERAAPFHIDKAADFLSKRDQSLLWISSSEQDQQGHEEPLSEDSVV